MAFHSFTRAWAMCVRVGGGERRGEPLTKAERAGRGTAGLSLTGLEGWQLRFHSKAGLVVRELTLFQWEPTVLGKDTCLEEGTEWKHCTDNKQGQGY